MRLRVFTEPQQGASYDVQLRLARHAEAAGFDAFFRSDHYLRMGGGDPSPGPTDSWITLAGLARETSTIRLGTLVNSATFRMPGPLAIAVAQVDAMSGGRVEMGLGAGWFDREHEAYGIPFLGTGGRFDVLEEQLAIVTGLWATEGGFSFEGKHYTVVDSPGLPKPAQRPGPPVIVGGGGPKRTPALAARFADEFNCGFRTPDLTAEQFGRVRAAVAAEGRTRPLRYSVAHTVCCGRTDAEIARRAEAIGRPVDKIHVSGTPEEVVARIRAFKDIGADTFYAQLMDMADLDHVDLIASEVMPHLGGGHA